MPDKDIILCYSNYCVKKNFFSFCSDFLYSSALYFFKNRINKSFQTSLGRLYNRL